jgi:hypothetical protein
MLEQPVHVQSQLIHKMVRVSGRNKNSIECTGLLHSFDPLSGCLAIVVFGPLHSDHSSKTDLVQVKLIPSHSIDRLEICADPITKRQKLKIDQLFMRKIGSKAEHVEDDQQAESDQDVQQRKQRLMECLKQNLVPFKETEEELQVGSMFRIRRPFRREDCECSKEIVLKRTMDLLKHAF